jgi:regulator of sirC expression with transglutaminase-like and TPR domain
MSRPTGPRHADSTAYAWFAEAVPQLHTTRGLVTLATAIARHKLQDVHPREVLNEIDRIAESVRAAVRNPTPPALLANLHERLFEELGFRGNASNYYDPRNSFLPSVLETRRGIPITLALLYKAVAEPLGIPVRGLNSPGHFLAQLELPDDHSIIDTFEGGTLLTVEEAVARIEAAFGRPLPHGTFWLQPASHDVWIRRMLLNLQNIYSMQQNEPDMAAMRELEALLPP